MNENALNESSSLERRRTAAPVSMWGELVVETAWRPSDKPKVEEGWLRANGYLPERRSR